MNYYNASIASFILGLFVGFLIADKAIVTHTLKNPKTGQWSRKNLTGFCSFLYAIWYSSQGMLMDKAVQEFVITSFLLLTATCFGISAYEKKNILENPTQ